MQLKIKNKISLYCGQATFILGSTFGCLYIYSEALIAKEPEYGFLNRIGNDADLLWRKPQFNTLYVPAVTWHNRYTYDEADIKKYNERPWGVGFGLEREESNHWSSLYVMTFQDSFRKWEPILGYGNEWRFRSSEDSNWRAGLGYTLGVTFRNNWNYLPIPVVLPMASINYKQASFQATYIPGTYGNGNVFFAWLRFQLPTSHEHG